MTPGAHLTAAIDVLTGWEADGFPPLDRRLAAWGRAHRFAGARDRSAIADRVYDVVRCWRSYGAWGGGGVRGRVLASVASELGAVDAIAALFEDGVYAPGPLSAEERARCRDGTEMDAAQDWPEWLRDALTASAAAPEAEIAAQRRRAPLDLRVNLSRTIPADAIHALRADGVDACDGPLPRDVAPAALRVIGGARKVDATGLLRDGRAEIQDAASQAAAHAARAAPGMTVLDFCAGGGGKTLALADAMRGAGRLIAHDVAPRRMADLPARAARAGVAVETIATAKLGGLKDACDIVFVDAPCSGSGAWARNPDAKWRLTSADLERLRAAQISALRAAARCVRPRGRLVYATCSLLRVENEDISAAFLREGGFDPAEDGPWGRRYSPAATATDGFFVTAFQRRP